MTPVRLLIDPPATGAWNMAVDEALLASAATGVTTLRFYAWSEPTLSLGYFQAAADRELHAASRHCPLVRRASGGGAIVHDRELTYSVALPGRGRFGDQAAAMYDAFHQTLVELLAVHCGGAVLSPGTNVPQLEPFLCFQRHTPGDVLIGDDKVAGSAQRRSRGALLQHGSILLSRSDCAPELPGINDVTGSSHTTQQLIDAWLPRLAERLTWHFERQALAPAESLQAQLLAVERFDDPAWNSRR
jgi:lipoate-protein ligase A